MTQKAGNLLQGKLWKQVLLFALPIAATSMLQQLFNSADMAVVGRFSSGQALAAVGSTSAIINLCINIFTGLSVGANVQIARSIGEGDIEKTKQSVHTALIMSVISGAVLMVLGEIFARPLLEIMGTPADIIGLARRYLQIYLLGTIFLMVYNFEAAILRASGDSRKPLYCLCFSGVLNLGLNLFFVIVCKMGVIGVAVATLIADAVNAGLLFYFLLKTNSVVRVRISELKLNRRLCKIMYSIGLPAAAQGALFNISNIIIQSGLNSLGSAVVAASTIAINAEIFVYYLINGFGQAAVTFNSQNLGAGNVKRCRQATRWCLLLGGILTEGFVLLLVFNSRRFAGIFATDEQIITIAAFRMQYILIFELFNMITEIVSGALRGLGHSALPAVLSIIFVCGIRVFWVFVIFSSQGTFQTLINVYPISWIAAAVSITAAYLYISRKINKNIGLPANSNTM